MNLKEIQNKFFICRAIDKQGAYFELGKIIMETLEQNKEKPITLLFKEEPFRSEHTTEEMIRGVLRICEMQDEDTIYIPKEY
jgi:hypothetical protein